MARFTVTNTNDSGVGSLRQAITNANALSGKDIINFCGVFDDGLAHTISLSGGGLSITDDITILGRNPNLLTISEDSSSRVFDITSGATATINGLTITNSYNNYNPNTTGTSTSYLAEGGLTGGGGISNEGVLTLNNSIITGNTVGTNQVLNSNSIFSLGGGIYNTGTLTVNDSIISDNSTAAYSSGTISRGLTFYTVQGIGYGSGIYNSGNLTLNNSNITGNSTGDQVINYSYGSNTSNDIRAYVTNFFELQYGGSGSIYNVGNLAVNHSTIGNNGSGILNTGGATVNYSNISSNTGYGINNGVGGNLTVNCSNISGNTGSGIINDFGGNLTVNCSTISDNQTSYGDYGAGIRNTGNATVNYSSITDNQTFAQGGGGGIYNVGKGILTVNYSNISGNQAGIGGGIDNNGILTTVNNSNITDNAANNGTINAPFNGYGGGIINYQFSTLIVNNSSISGNTAGTGGGGIFNSAQYGLQNGIVIYSKVGVVTVSDSTIADNQAHFGGGIYNSGTLTVDNSAIEYNKVFGAFGVGLSSGTYESGNGGGIYNNSNYATATVYSNAIACNFDTSLEGSNNFISPDDIAGKFIDNGYNWIGTTTATTTNGDYNGVGYY